MLIVGLTGGIASGKSTIADMFKKEGAYIIDIDMISRDVVKPGKPAWQDVVDIFGKGVLNEDQTLNRKKVGDIIFSDAEKRKKLEEIIHPKITAPPVRRNFLLALWETFVGANYIPLGIQRIDCA